MNQNRRRTFLWGVALGVISMSSVTSNNAEAGPTRTKSVVIASDSAIPTIEFSVDDLEKSLRGIGYRVSRTDLAGFAKVDAEYRIIVTTDSNQVAKQIIGKSGVPKFPKLEDEGYAVRMDPRDSKNYWVLGGNVQGAMYGVLDLAETIRIDRSFGNVKNVHKNPHMDVRGIKFNIPLDARTPSYSDDSDAGQKNIAEMWSMDFWRTTLDAMARNKFNVLTLWSLHPFPSLVKVPGYESVALSDVWRSKKMFDARIGGHGMWNPSRPADVILKMTIEEKIKHWRNVMQYAQDRGIDVYVFTWNAFIYGTEKSGFDFSNLNSARTKDYFRKSVIAMYDTYPNLRGIGVTAGENMKGIKDAAKWLWDTYGEGTKAALLKYPKRRIKFVHRLHFIGAQGIMRNFKNLPRYNDPDSSFEFSFKYSVAHMHSSLKPLDVKRFLKELPPGKRTWLTVRQDTTYMMRVGDPDFAREYIKNMPPKNQLAGIYIGPDGYTLGREFISKEPDSPRQVVLEKQWYFFSLYGKLSYDPTIPTSHFQSVLSRRFPEVNGKKLQEAWSYSSRVFPWLNRFYWGRVDYRWYPEASWRYRFGRTPFHTCSEELGFFHTVDDFISPLHGPMTAKQDGEKPNIMSIKEYCRGVSDGRLTPPEVAEKIFATADKALVTSAGMKPGDNKELRYILGDIEAMSYLGRHYGHKIIGATELQKFRQTGDTQHQARAVKSLKRCYDEWLRYAAKISTQYVPQVLTRLSPPATDVNDVLPEIKKDIAQASVPPVDLDYRQTFDGEKKGRFTINNGFRKWESPVIRIAKAAIVRISADILESEGGMEGDDFLRLYYRIDGGELIPFSQSQGRVAPKTVTVTGLRGRTIQVIIKGRNSAPDEYYHVDRVRVVLGARD